MNYSTNKVQVNYFVELPQSNLSDYTNSLTFPWLFPDILGVQKSGNPDINQQIQQLRGLSPPLGGLSPILPEVVPEIMQIQKILRGDRSRSHRVWSLTRQFAKYGEWVAASVGHPWICLGGEFAPDPYYRLSLCACRVCPSHIFFTWRRPWQPCKISNWLRNGMEHM